jgi:hypothetical protein
MVYYLERGIELAFRKKVQKIIIEGFFASDFEVEIGSMDYRFEINGIL